jgi:hypothetical protein
LLKVNSSKVIIIHVIPEIPTPIFLKEIPLPKIGARITFSEYMESLYEQMKSEIKEKLK